MRQFKLIAITGFLITFILFGIFSHLNKISAADNSVQINFPAILSEGPGVFLPNSPFYFLDKLKKTFTLLFTVNPVKRAEEHAIFAGERLAELRVMLFQKNTFGEQTALSEFSREVNDAGDELTYAAARGEKTSVAAQELTETMKTYRNILSEVKSQAKTPFLLEINLARENLRKAKYKISSELPDVLARREIKNDLELEIADKVQEASVSAQDLQSKIDELKNQMSQEVSSREPSISEKIKDKRNEKMTEIEAKLLNKEQEKQDKLLSVQKEVIEKIQDAAKKLKEAAGGFSGSRD